MNTNLMNNSILTITKEQLASLPVATFVGGIHLIERGEDVDAAIANLRSSDVIGFDTETRPSFKKGYLHTVSLLQLSTRTDCFLFRLNKIGLCQPLVDLLEDEKILKVGLSIHDDFHSLRKLTEIDPKGFIDLQHYVKEFRIIDNSLTRIYGILFGERISKGQRLTNWEAETLSPAQQGYAALDALACVTIYDYLNSGKFDPQQSEYLTTPPEPAALPQEATPVQTQAQEKGAAQNQDAGQQPEKTASGDKATKVVKKPRKKRTKSSLSTSKSKSKEKTEK